MLHVNSSSKSSIIGIGYLFFDSLQVKLSEVNYFSPSVVFLLDKDNRGRIWAGAISDDPFLNEIFDDIFHGILLLVWQSIRSLIDNFGTWYKWNSMVTRSPWWQFCWFSKQWAALA